MARTATAVPAEPSAKVVPLPDAFPPDQQFVSVSDSDVVTCGFDNGPETGGYGAWARGVVRPWTATSAVPLALRSPSDGLIVRGYVEPVESMTYDAKGKPVVTSTKYFATRAKDGSWHAAAPTKRALARAYGGAASITKALQPVRGPSAQRALESGVRPSDLPVG